MGTSMSDGGAAARGRPVNPIILIPARLQSVRLPDKPLADIAGVPMIVHVMRRAEEADLGRVAVACAEREIAEAVTAAGGEAVMTRADHASGSDRIYEALMHLDGDGKHDAVINLQGDLPTVTPDLPRAALDLLHDPEVDIGTLAAEIRDGCERDDPNVVKAVVSTGSAAAASCTHHWPSIKPGRSPTGPPGSTRSVPLGNKLAPSCFTKCSGTPLAVISNGASRRCAAEICRATRSP